MKPSMMKKSILAALFSLAISGTAFALPSQGDNVTVLSGAYGGANGGGEFLLNVDNTLDSYLAFCLEMDENITLGSSYYVSSVQDVVLGGGNNTDGGDPLSTESQWLFYNYAFNKDYLKTLTGVTDDDVLANKVQMTLWMFEDEFTSGVLYDQAVVFAASFTQYVTGEFNHYVTAVNLGKDNQSMIVADPVPEPATMMLFGTGIAALFGLARRKK